MPLRAQGLAKEWAPTNDPLNQYKQTYVLLYSLSSQPNNAPTSPNAPRDNGEKLPKMDYRGTYHGFQKPNKACSDPCFLMLSQ